MVKNFSGNGLVVAVLLLQAAEPDVELDIFFWRQLDSFCKIPTVRLRVGGGGNVR
jgi:hypothetical protein